MTDCDWMLTKTLQIVEIVYNIDQNEAKDGIHQKNEYNLLIKVLLATKNKSKSTLHNR